MKLPEPQTRTFSGLIEEIKKGQIKIPQFQRDFVWTIQKSAGLIDSILKGYPIGTFIFWRTKDRLRSIRNLGEQQLPEPQEGDAIDYVLDGQQRLTSLYACLNGISIRRENGKDDDFSKIFINLKSEEDEQIVVIEKDEETDSFISILDLLEGDFTVLGAYPKKYHKKLILYQDRIKSYQYPIIQIKDASISVATEIFTRINVGGKPLSVFEIMVAKTFDYEKDFDLSEKYQQLIEKLSRVDYETISDTTVLQTVSIILSGECKKQAILGLDKNEFIEMWGEAADAIEKAVWYFRSFYRIPVSQLLPYNAMIVPFAYFFFKYKKDKPTGNKQKYLRDFFWKCSLSEHYSSGLEGKLAQDVKRIDKILADKLPSYDWPINSSADFVIDNGWFSSSRSYVKAILCIYAYHQPKSFNNEAIVEIGNSWLKRANSKNYHHFFPKSYLKKINEEDSKINHILNITIVDDFLNKREIGAKKPSVYMRKFKKDNPILSETMKTHLIDDLEEFGIWDDDYGAFFRKRAERVSKEIDKRIIKQKIDSKEQPELKDDYEQEGTVAE
ncbi:MAG: DUF262 domain-containing protein [Gammaproteobacteria bacterium]|nr:DUF262 domain-containing protein [Gammaproteobacteria bacterium]